LNPQQKNNFPTMKWSQKAVAAMSRCPREWPLIEFFTVAGKDIEAAVREWLMN
jgi:hypothetical protein